MKQIKLIAFISILFCFVTFTFAQDSSTTAKLTEEQKRFDIDGNGTLSPEESQLMLRITGFEAFTGNKLTSEEIKNSFNNRPQDRDGPPPGIQGGPPGFGGRPPNFGGGSGRGPRPAEKLVEQYDTNKDGKLTGEERKAALESRGDLYLPDQRAGTPTGDIESDVKASVDSTPKGSPAFYDAGILRTLYLRFHDEDWYAQLNAFYRTDVEVPAEMVVDGKVYSDVGIRFRGTSSYFTVQSAKKSFNVAIDYGDDGQRLYGYKTLNLLNGHVDVSFLREVMYNRIARDYIPAMKTNLVRLVINGESWGVYINLQQFNKDFLDEWFDTREGVRWKIGPGGGALTYAGTDLSAYQRSYQLKTANVDNPWDDLIALCEMLDAKTPDATLVKDLPSVFNVDRALWQLAVSNVFMDDDGYIHKGGDFSLYQDVKGRFHLISHDNNETFRFGRERRGGPGGRGPGGWSWGEMTSGMVSPTTHADNQMRPVISRLLDIPEWKARYIAHVRTVANDWLDWDAIGTVIQDYHTLIDADVEKDEKKLYSYQDFQNSVDGEGGRAPTFKQFVTQRREFLENHPEFDKPTPQITSVFRPENNFTNEPVEIVAELDETVAPDKVFLYYGTDGHDVFQRKEMSKNDGQYIGSIPGFPAGMKVYFYVEANAVKTHGTTTFSPARAEFGAASYWVTPPRTDVVPVVINELMAANTKSITDPQGDHEDWLELHNITDKTVNLTGMYLTDKIDNLTKWEFPEDTSIPPKGYLIVWLDEDGKAKDGLHANFKLSRTGETLLLVDTDARENRVIDLISFGNQERDTAIGRLPNGIGGFQVLQMSPGKQNNLVNKITNKN